jgi:hypothetical protein
VHPRPVAFASNRYGPRVATESRIVSHATVRPPLRRKLRLWLRPIVRRRPPGLRLLGIAAVVQATGGPQAGLRSSHGAR